MGILVEYNPDLALRDMRHFKEGSRQEPECIPEPLETGRTYAFLKGGQRLYWLQGELPLVRTEGGGKLSLPIASIIITEVTHYLSEGKAYTSGTYVVKEVFTDEQAHFNGFAKI
jgi:hypothetical protein